MKFFSIDSTFSRIGTKVFDIIVLMLLWITLTCVGFGITFGASTTAVFYAMDKVIINDSGYLLKSFFKSFKLNFIKSTVVWLIIALAYFIVGFNIYNFNSIENIPFIIYPLQFFILLEIIFISIYAFTILAKLEVTIKELFVKSFLLAHKHLFTTLASVAVIVILIFLTIKVSSIFMIIGPGIWLYINSKLIIGRVLSKYFSEDELNNYEFD